MQNFAAIDFETANTNRSSICSVGVVIVRNGEIVDQYYSLVRPTPNYYNFYNIQVHGIQAHDTADAPTFPTVWAEIEKRIAGLPLVAHNKGFDESCLKKVFAVYDMPYPDYIFHCTLQAARRHYPTAPNHQLHTISARCGYELTAHHHALADAEACAWIAREIL